MPMFRKTEQRRGMMQMHERVKRYIGDRGLSQKIIASNMGIPESKLSLILNGKRRMTVDDYESI